MLLPLFYTSLRANYSLSKSLRSIDSIRFIESTLELPTGSTTSLPSLHVASDF